MSQAVKSSHEANVSYYDASQVSIQPVTAWQGIRGGNAPGEFLITGTSAIKGTPNANGLLYQGPINGVGGTSYQVNFPGAVTSSIYGPDNLGSGRIRLVGSYRNSDSSTATVAENGLLFEGTLADLSLGRGTFQTVNYPGAKYNFVHSTMGGLAVGNYDGPTTFGAPVGVGNCYIYHIANKTFTKIENEEFVSITAYGIWQNGPTSFTICGGGTTLASATLGHRARPVTHGLLVDYDSTTKQFSNWKTLNYPLGAKGLNFLTHLEGICGLQKGVYTLSAQAAQIDASDTDAIQGAFVTVTRNADGTFDDGEWVNLNYPGSSNLTTSGNSVYDNNVVGVVFGNPFLSYQATVNF